MQSPHRKGPQGTPIRLAVGDRAKMSQMLSLSRDLALDWVSYFKKKKKTHTNTEYKNKRKPGPAQIDPDMLRPFQHQSHSSY